MEWSDTARQPRLLEQKKDKFWLTVGLCALTAALFKRRIPAKYEAAVNFGGLVVLLGFMLLVTLQDVTKLFR